MFEQICTYPLPSDLFAQALHPTTPTLAVGLSSGHVQVFRIPDINNTDSDSGDHSSPALSGLGEIETQWKTKRHKVSCRALAYSLDGDALYSAGSDGIIKAADASTGKVFAKAVIPSAEAGRRKADAADADAATLLHVLSPQTLLLATDSSALHLYDLRASDRTFSRTKPQATYFPHEEYISSLTPLPPSAASTSGYSKQWVSVGGTTLAVTDLRKGVVTRSSDQDDELLSSVYVDGFSKKKSSVGEKVIVGDSSGVITLWERGVWDDQDERIVIDRGLNSAEGGESVEVLRRIPTSVAGSNRYVAAGMGGGIVACVKLGDNKVTDVFRHDDVEAVVALDFDINSRMISGGGQVVKVWAEKMAIDEEDEEEEEEDESDDSDDEVNGTEKHDLDSDDSDDDSDDGQKNGHSRKKRKGESVAKPSGLSLGSFSGLD